MGIWRSALLRRQVRVGFYVLIVAGLFLLRGPESWRTLGKRLRPAASDSTHLVVAGRDLAPGLLAALASAYGREYPQVSIDLQGGGTNHALEALLDARVKVATLARPLDANEQALFVQAHGRPPLCEPIALGALVLLAASTDGVDSVTCAQLEAMLQGKAPTPPRRLYCEDPNLGAWDALVSAMGVDRTEVESSGAVGFLPDRSSLVAALQSDPDAIGLVSSFTLPADPLPEGLAFVAVRCLDAPAAVWPTHQDTAYGRYPLLHRLYVACRDDATGQAAKFMTFVLSGRGQRLVERAGYLPARQVLREILLDDAPIGAR